MSRLEWILAILRSQPRGAEKRAEPHQGLWRTRHTVVTAVYALLFTSLVLSAQPAQRTPGQVMLLRLCDKLTHEAVYAKDTGTLSQAMADGLVDFAQRTRRRVQNDGSTRTFTLVVEDWHQVVSAHGFQGGARVQGRRASGADNNNIATWDIGNWPVTAAIISLNTALLENGR